MPETNFFWEPLSDNILQERDEVGALTGEYTTEPGLYGNVISQNRGGVESHFHFDAIGSALAVTEDNQQITDVRSYSSFGELTENAGSTTLPFQYVGQKGYYFDTNSNNTYLSRRRCYQGDVARWLSRDPICVRITAMSPYVYVTNRPTILTDPSGHQADFAQGAAAPNPVCQVQLACIRLIFGAAGPKHCGIEVRDGLGIARFHVEFGATCAVRNRRVFVFGTVNRDYYAFASWGDTSGKLCQCIRATVATLNGAAPSLPYAPIPGNFHECELIGQPPKCSPGKNLSTCNSNYTTHCLMKKCGIDFTGWFLTPVGWNHRMKKCTKCSPRIAAGSGGCGVSCGCDNWATIDSGWCADPPPVPLAADQNIVTF